MLALTLSTKRAERKSGIATEIRGTLDDDTLGEDTAG